MDAVSRLPDFALPADQVAPLLLGCVLRKGPVAIRLTEVEAYLGQDDPASHAFGGPRGRAEVMFGPPGRMYVYLSYGVHLAGNIVCSPPGRASAVLLRAGEVVEGVQLARLRRGDPAGPDRVLARGPGNLGRALGLQLSDNSRPVDTGGRPGPVDGSDAEQGFGLAPGAAPSRVLRGPRVGISRAVDEPLRFWIADDPTVSRARLSRA